MATKQLPPVGSRGARAPLTDDTTLRHDGPGVTMTRPDALRRSGAADDELVAIIAPYDDVPDECTIFPTGFTEDELLTTWLSAQEGAYVALAEMR